MAAYKWSCRACEHSNEPGATLCTTCRCPATPTAAEVDAHKAHFDSTQGRKFACLKCGHDRYEVGELRASGGIVSSFFEVESEKFSFVACEGCGYTEFYRRESSVLRNLMDIGIG